MEQHSGDPSLFPLPPTDDLYDCGFQIASSLADFENYHPDQEFPVYTSEGVAQDPPALPTFVFDPSDLNMGSMVLADFDRLPHPNQGTYSPAADSMGPNIHMASNLLADSDSFPQFNQDVSSPATQFTSPNSSSNIGWTPSWGGDLPLSDSSVSPDSPYFSPDQPTAPWTFPFPDELPDPMSFNQTLAPTVHVGDDATTGPEPVPNTQGLSSDARISTPRRRRGQRSALTKREQRKRDKPVKCPICNKGSAYKADMEKHVISNHPERAHEFDISTDRQPCLVANCNKTFARRDHALRHCQRRHGWSKTEPGARRKRRQQG